MNSEYSWSKLEKTKLNSVTSFHLKARTLLWRRVLIKWDRHLNGGFTLVEVMLALSIAAFCMVVLMGLIPVGLQNYQQAANQGILVNLCASVAQDLRSTTVSNATSRSPQFSFLIPPSGGAGDVVPQSVYVDASGQITGGASDPASLYRLSVGFAPPAMPNLRSATVARILVTFPARADTKAAWPASYASMFETTVSLNRN